MGPAVRGPVCSVARRTGPRRATGWASFVLTTVFALLPAPAPAASNCWTIQDADQRAYCRARQTRSAGNCSAIGDYALRQTCRARLASPGKGSSQCNSISNAWEREKCRDEAARR